MNFQIRGIYVASAFVPLVAGVVFDRALTLLRAPGAAPWRRAAALALAVALLGKAWAFALAAPVAWFGGNAAGDASQAADPWRTCTDPARLAALDALPPATILAAIDLGPNLLLHTHHAIVAAPYHRAVAGILADVEGLGGSEADLARHAAATGADLLLVCEAGLGRASPTAFATRLGRGEVGADWLDPVASVGGGLKVWRVRRDRLPCAR